MLIIIVSKKDLPLRIIMHSVEGSDSHKCSAQMEEVPGYPPGKQRQIHIFFNASHVSHYQGPELITVITSESGPANSFDEIFIRQATRAPSIDMLLPAVIGSAFPAISSHLLPSIGILDSGCSTITLENKEYFTTVKKVDRKIQTPTVIPTSLCSTLDRFHLSTK